MNLNFETHQPQIEKEPVLPPGIKVIEENPSSHKLVERSLHTIIDSHILDRNKMSRGELDEELTRVSRAIIGNERLEKMVVKGIKSKGNGSVAPFAELMNVLTEECISLSDAEIDSILARFKRSVISNAMKYASEFNLSGQELVELQKGLWILGGEDGVKSATRFIQARKKLHPLTPEIFSAIYIENYLDAQHKIDCIEAIDDPAGIILNLIQIKSKEYEPDEFKTITQAHRSWVNGFVVDLNSYENNFSVEPPNSARFKEFVDNVSLVEEMFLEILTTGVLLDTKTFFNQIGINELSRVERVWVLDKLLPALEEDIDVFAREGTFEAEHIELIRQIIEDIKSQLESVKREKKNLESIIQINSICTLAEQEKSKVTIFEAGGKDAKAVKVARN